MSNGFIHSEKVPRVYKAAAKIVQEVAENGASLKQLIYEKKHLNIGATYALAVSTLKNASQLDRLLRESQLLFKEKRLDPWLARVLIFELLWGKKTFKSTCKPVQTVLSYEKELRDLEKNLDKTETTNADDARVAKQPRYVRVNTLVSSVDEIIRSFTEDDWLLLPESHDYPSFLIALSELTGSCFVRDFHIPELLVFPRGTQFHQDPRYKAGAIILQDKASCFPAFLLRPEAGSTVLDMCAAPGMKTTHLAAIMRNRGRVIAIERDERRYKTLCQLVDEAHADCVEKLNADSMKISAKEYPNVEYILVDPSCSGSGMTDRQIFDDSKCSSSSGRLKRLQSFQVLLLRHALASFPKVKRVVYSTCSLYPEENEMVVEEVLNGAGESYTLKSVKESLDGHWSNFSCVDYACKDKCLYARPEFDRSNGFFVAVFERNSRVPLPEFSRIGKTAENENDESVAEKNTKGRRKRVKIS